MSETIIERITQPVRECVGCGHPEIWRNDQGVCQARMDGYEGGRCLCRCNDRPAQPSAASETEYLNTTCTETECRLCRLPPFARKSGMKHSGLTAFDPVTAASGGEGATALGCAAHGFKFREGCGACSDTHNECCYGDDKPCSRSAAPTPAPEPVEGETLLRLVDAAVEWRGSDADWQDKAEVLETAIDSLLELRSKEPCGECRETNYQCRSTRRALTPCIRLNRVAIPASRMTDEEKVEVAEIAERLDTLSPGPWKHKCRDTDENSQHVIDYDFIADAPTIVRRLLQLLVKKG